MSKEPEIIRREVCSFRLKPLTAEAIRALAGKMSISNAELVETAVDRMLTDVTDDQIKTVKAVREHIRKADDGLARLERGQA